MVVTTSNDINLEYFDAWSGAKSTLDTLVEKGLCRDLEYILEEMYPDGIDETTLNDILWFEDDWIAECLGFDSWEDLENDGEDE